MYARHKYIRLFAIIYSINFNVLSTSFLIRQSESYHQELIRQRLNAFSFSAQTAHKKCLNNFTLQSDSISYRLDNIYNST